MVNLLYVIVAMAPMSATGVAEQAVMLNFMMAANNPFFAHNFLSGFPPVSFPGKILDRQISTGLSFPFYTRILKSILTLGHPRFDQENI